MAQFSTPIDDRWFDDYKAGAVYEFGDVTITEEEILEFAHRFDPQPIHTDPAYAAGGPFHGLIASGWHTSGIFMRLFADHYLSKVASLASPGVDELRWPHPVRPATGCGCASASWRPARPGRSRTGGSCAPAPSCSTRRTGSS